MCAPTGANPTEASGRCAALFISSSEDPSGLLYVLVLALVLRHALPGTALSPLCAPSWPSPLKSGALHGPPSPAPPRTPTRLSSLSPFLHLLSTGGAITSPCAPLARGEKPARSPETQRHSGLHLSQPPVPVLRDHRRSRSCASLGMAPMVTLNTSRPFEALPAAPRSVLGAIPLVSSENPFPPDRRGADPARAFGLDACAAERVFGYRQATITSLSVPRS
jgi:hypothetical protein